MMALVGAQGSMKTSLLLGGIENALSRGMTVQFFSLDMTPGEIQERRIQRRLRCHQYVLHEMIRAGDPQVGKAAADICRADDGRVEIFGNDGQEGDWTIDGVLERARTRMPNALCIDYLTLLRRPGQRVIDCVDEAMPKLKKAAQRYGIRVVILSQMGRDSKREQLSGLTGGHAKGGGSVEEMVHSEIELFKDAPLGDEASPIIATVTKTRRGRGRSYSLGYEPKCMLFTGEAVRVERASKSAQKRAFADSAMVGAASFGDGRRELDSNQERAYKS
jgi:hypothetical protein